MKVIIIEDEELAAKRLESMVLKYDPDIQVVQRLASIEESVEWFRKNEQPDLIFLDIHLEDGLSFSIFEHVNINVPIIFTTAFDEYAIKAFKFKSIDYLLKPIIHEELKAAIDKYKEWNKSKHDPINIKQLLDIMYQKENTYRNRFSITIGTKIKTIDIEDVAYFFSIEGITYLVNKTNNQYPVDYSLDQLSSQLDPKFFFRINRQYLIHLKSIKQVHVFPKSRLKIELTPQPQTEIFVSLDKVVRFKEWLDS